MISTQNDMMYITLY